MYSNNRSKIAGVCLVGERVFAFGSDGGKKTYLYTGQDFFEACCRRKSWENSIAGERAMKKGSIRLAKIIYDYIKLHGKVTRTELYDHLVAGEKSIDDRIRKLIEFDMVVDTGERVRGEGPRPLHILAIGPVEYSPTIFAPGKKGPKVMSHNENLVKVSLDYLETFIRGAVQNDNAKASQTSVYGVLPRVGHGKD